MTSQAMDYPLIASMVNSAGARLAAVTGSAGSGKTFAAERLSALHDYTVYSADFRFIGDSTDRRELLERKQARSAEDYKDSSNQFNWWDWSAIYRDLSDLANGSSVVLEAPYDRKTGQKTEPVKIQPARTILFEGALLGPPQLIDKFSRIFFMCTPQKTRFDRILEKDFNRRSFSEILARFLITEYSETLYYKNLFSWAQDKLVFVETDTGRPCSKPELPGDLFVPFRVNL